MHSRRIRQIVALILLLPAATLGGAEEQPEASEANRAAKARLELMRTLIDDFQLRSSQVEPPAGLKFGEKPLLRYNDQTRPGDKGVQALLDATAWRLGETGRPLAIVTLEIYPSREARAVLSYEFVSLSPLTFEMKNSRGIAWRPASAALTMRRLEDAPEPADTKRARLGQLRQLARRFTAQGEWQGVKDEYRLLAQPIDRYDDVAAGVLDGAMFVFANGTNPELGLLLECSDREWSYGVFCLTAATLTIQLDGKSFDAPPTGSANTVEASHTGTQHWMELPE
ncbi:MAG TPA: hypothetical protein VJ783_18450, partial [Pirellulales bacterium]|nr:hypothetical protein [Pirellulales bacterium]